MFNQSRRVPVLAPVLAQQDYSAVPQSPRNKSASKSTNSAIGAGYGPYSIRFLFTRSVSSVF